jgi:iron complex outermembrane recepter protein
MNLMHKLIYPLFMGAILLAVNAQAAAASSGKVSGVALGPSHEGIPGIIVTISKEGSAPQSAVTGYGGEFCFSQVDPGQYQVCAALEGVMASEKVPVVVQPGKTALATLAIAFLKLHETITVLGRCETLATTELRECPAVDLGEAMMRMPGLAKVRKGAIANDIVLRGMQRDNINVLIDGGRIYGACPNRMDSPAFHVDFSEIERIEITKGPFDIENQGSLGGLVNIVTLKPEKGFHLSAALAGGSAAYINPSLNISYGGHRLSGAFGFSLRSSGPYLDGAGRRFTETANYLSDRLDSRVFGVGTAWGKLYLTPRDAEKIEIAYTRQQADTIFYPGLLMDSPWDNADRLGIDWSRQKLTGIVVNFQIHAYASRVHHWMTDELRISGQGTPRGYSMATEAETQAFGLKAEATVEGCLIGFEGVRRNWNASTMMAKMNYAAQASIPNVDSSMLGAFIARDWDIGSNLQLHAGARIDQTQTTADSSLANTNLYFAYHSTRSTSRTDTFPSASIRLTWKPAPKLEVSGNLGRTVRIPDPAERYFTLKRTGSDWVGNPELLPTRNIGVDMKATWHFKMGSIGGSVFYQSLADWITLINQPRVVSQPGVVNAMARSYTNTDARLWGAEAEFSFALSPRLFAAGTMSWVRGEKNIDPARHITSANLGEVPPFSSRLYVRYDSGHIYGEVEGIITGAQNRVDADLLEPATPGWQILNLRLGTTFHDFRIQAAVDNVFDRLYSEHLANARDPFRTGALVYEPGRRFIITAIYRL